MDIVHSLKLCSEVYQDKPKIMSLLSSLDHFLTTTPSSQLINPSLRSFLLLVFHLNKLEYFNRHLKDRLTMMMEE